MLLSRVADALYWTSRYLERAAHTARLLDVRLDLGLDRKPDSDGWDFSRLYATVGLEGPVAPGPMGLIDALVFDPRAAGSILACVTAARDNARQIREEIGSDMWEQINALFLGLRDARLEGTWSARPHYLARLVIDGVHLFDGLTDATMGHGEGWQYLQVGRFLERARATAALVGAQFRCESIRQPADLEWIGLLRSCAALEAYCRCYTADLRPARIAEFLLLSAECPRSVRFAAARVEAAVRALAQFSGRPSGGRAERLAGRLHASLDYGQVDEILNDDPHASFAAIDRHCVQIHTALYQSFVTYAVESALPA